MLSDQKRGCRHEDAIVNRIVDEPGTPYSQTWPNTVAVCAVCKLESNANVKEWLDYYKYLGVDKIYLQVSSTNCASQKWT